MNSLIISTVLITTILAVSTYIAIWSRKKTNARLLALVLLIPLGLLGFGSAWLPLGHPSICYSGYNIPTGKLDVLGFKVIKDDIIFLTLDVGGREPFSCSIPYRNQDAERLEGDKRSGTPSKFKGKGTGGQSAPGGEPDGITLPEPVAPLPDKPTEGGQTLQL